MNNRWFKYFLGTPRRFLLSLSVPLLVFAYFRADLIERAIVNLLNALFSAVGPFISPLLTLLFISFGFRYLYRAAFPKKSSKK